MISLVIYFTWPTTLIDMALPAVQFNKIYKNCRQWHIAVVVHRSSIYFRMKHNFSFDHAKAVH
jgi:hypothetical protein